MAVPSLPVFSAGQILTSANMNQTSDAVNGLGLFIVASGPLATATTNFQGCFTSDFRNYRIVISQISFSGAGDVYFRLLSGATPNVTANYFWALRGIKSTSVSADNAAGSQTVYYSGASAVGATSANASVIADIYSPNLSANTLITSSAISLATTFDSRQGGGALNVTTAYDGIQILTDSAVTLLGNVTIYGYRNSYS